MLFDKCTKAPWQPNKIVFVGVWGILYSLYFVTLWNTRHRASTSVKKALWLGLIVNVLWVPIFVINSKLGALVILGMIYSTVDSERKLRAEGFTSEANFMIVYLSWLSFAFTMNAYIALHCEN